MPEDREFVQSLQRGVEVLQSFDAQHSRMTLSEVAARTNLTRATARRFLLTLVAMNLVATDGKRFWLLPRVLDIGYRYLSSLPWWQTSQPIVEEVSTSIGESCSISVLDGVEIVYVARAAVHRILATNISVGSRFPAYCTAMGKAILANLGADDLTRYLEAAELKKLTPNTITTKKALKDELQLVRKNGYAFSNQELEMNLIGLAVPLLDSQGRPAGALGASLLAGTDTKTKLIKRCLPRLREGAQRIAQSLKNTEFQT